ncbi:MAG: hypothetical protein IRY94_17785 [Rhodospirillaceae bacterium]|nr:hypothetical protein [Rhodospirillaceae bacterium]
MSAGGTRFRLFLQAPFLHPGRPPEIVELAAPPGSIGAGPSDERLYVVDPVGKRRAYGVAVGPYGTPHLYLPPWRGPIVRPAQPDAAGHFDHIPLGTPQFAQAHVFAAIAFVLDVWEQYFGRRIGWHFARHFDRLEVSLLPALDNAHAGYGYMEVGAHHDEDGALVPYALNFDVLAHELGHLIIYATVGIPDASTADGEYFGFHESAADMTAIIAALRFDAMVEQLLEDTRGNLYAWNELNRFAELSTTTQIRLASNSETMSRFAAGWSDEHELSQPLTGALFDCLVDIFQENLVDRRLIGRDVADFADRVERLPELAPVVQAAYDEAYPGREEGFRAALRDAGDYFGLALARAWQWLSPHFLTYVTVARALLAADAELSGGRYREPILESFTWRDIGAVRVGPRLTPPGRADHAASPRTLVPELGRRLPGMAYRERALLAGTMY